MKQILPIDAHLEAIAAAVRAKPAVVIKAAPGAGKTTRVPAALLNCIDGCVIVLEPRRLAARLSAERIAAELSTPVGDTVGYQIRFEGKSSPATRILFVTEGIFLRMVRDDPTLKGIGCVVIDEFHERHVQTDLALALVRKTQLTSRADLRLVVMSATLDTAPLERYLGQNTGVFDVEGRTFPVAIEYLPEIEDNVVAAVTRITQDARCPGDVLVFLTGIAEIRRAAEALSAIAERCAIDVLPLAADLSPREQQRVFASSARRKVIIATNVAETSLTLPGVTGVIDLGRAKIAGHAPWSGMPTLDIKRVSQASCIQRAGRAGRVRAGVAYRLFSEGDFLGRPAFTVPDIKRLDFADTYLELLGVAQARGDSACAVEDLIPWFEAPDPKAVEAARQLLTLLGLVDASGALTAFGARAAVMPLHPRLAAMVTHGMDAQLAAPALMAACLISEGMLLSRGHAAVTHEASDVKFQMEILSAVLRNARLPYQALERMVDRNQAQRMGAGYLQLAQRLRIAPHFDVKAVDDEQLAAVLLAGFPDRVAKRRTLAVQHQKPREMRLFNFCMGRGGILADSSVVRDTDLILALDASETQAKSKDQSISIWVASELSASLLLRQGGALLSRRREIVWSDDAERVDVMDRTYYGQIVIGETRAAVSDVDQSAIEEVLRAKLAERWPKPFESALDLAEYHQRIRILRDLGEGDCYPVFDGEMLELLQASIAEGRRSFRDIAARTMLSYIEEQLPYADAKKLADLLPDHVTLKNGRKLKIVYETDRPPYVTGFIQDFFGVSASPSLINGRVPLTIHLTAPNRRPMQVTSDLAGFWERSYAAARRELARDYPRHHWPDDPRTAPPVLHKSRLPKS